MISLFIDTSLSNVSISIVKDNKILSLIQKGIPNMHSVYTTKFVKEALDQAGCDANDIDNIMVVNGPGSFTGLRIGATIVNTLASELNIPLFDHHDKKHQIIIPDYGREANITPPRK